VSVFQYLLLARHGIDVRVDYYDQKEEACFKTRYRNAAEIDRVAGSTVHLPLAELLTYSLFVNKRPELPGASSFAEIKANLNSSARDFDLGLRVTKSSLKTVLTGNDQISDLSHKIGTGVALSIANRLTGLNEADWNRMTVGRAKAEDFSFASESTGHVQVEAKGSSVKDHSGAKPATVRQHAADIRAKFRASRARDTGHPVTRYGVIGSIDTREDSVMRSWLVDPPEGMIDRNPRDQQLLNRLSFVAEILDVVLPSSAFAMQLYKRIATLAQVDDVFAYSRIPLSGTAESWRQTIFLTQPQDVTRHFFGTILTLLDGTRFFYGVRSEWIDAAQQQDFDQIMSLKSPPHSESVAISMPGRFEEKLDGPGPRIAADRSLRPRTEVAHVHTASSGRVFGIAGEWAGRPGTARTQDE
jgi:hypothetical protein